MYFCFFFQTKDHSCSLRRQFILVGPQRSHPRRTPYWNDRQREVWRQMFALRLPLRPHGVHVCWPRSVEETRLQRWLHSCFYGIEVEKLEQWLNHHQSSIFPFMLGSASSLTDYFTWRNCLFDLHNQLALDITIPLDKIGSTTFESFWSTR